MDGDQGPAAAPAGPPDSRLLSAGAFADAMARQPGDPDFFLEALQLREECEGLAGLVALAGSASSAAAEQAAWALGRLAGGDDAARDDIVAAGAPAVLALALHCHDSVVAEQAAEALVCLAADGEGAEARRDAIADAGATEALVAAFLQKKEEKEDEQENLLMVLSLWALSLLARGDGGGADARRTAIVAAAAAALVHTLVSAEAGAIMAAANLAELATGVEGADARQSALIAAGVAPALVAALQRPDGVAAPALDVIWIMVGDGAGADARREAFAAAGAIAALVSLLESSPSLPAVRVLSLLARGDGKGV